MGKTKYLIVIFGLIVTAFSFVACGSQVPIESLSPETTFPPVSFSIIGSSAQPTAPTCTPVLITMAPSSKAVYATVTLQNASGTLNLRSAADINATRIIAIPNGSRVQVLEKGEWIRIKYNGITGYVMSVFLKMEK